MLVICLEATLTISTITLKASLNLNPFRTALNATSAFTKRILTTATTAPPMNAPAATCKPGIKARDSPISHRSANRRIALIKVPSEATRAKISVITFTTGTMPRNMLVAIKRGLSVSPVRIA